MTSEESCRERMSEVKGIVMFYLFPLIMFGVGLTIVLTGIVEPISWGFMFMIFGGVTFVFWSISRLFL